MCLRRALLFSRVSWPYSASGPLSPGTHITEGSGASFLILGSYPWPICRILLRNLHHEAILSRLFLDVAQQRARPREIHPAVTEFHNKYAQVWDENDRLIAENILLTKENEVLRQLDA